MKRVFIVYNTDKPLAFQLYEESKKFFDKRDIEVVDNVRYADFAVVIGGDGTLLRASRKFINKNNFFVIAVNAGNLGFLAEIKKENMIEAYEEFLAGDFHSETRYILEVKVNNKVYYSLNEILLSKTGAMQKMLRMDFKCNNEEMCTYKADGVIIATPTGSTAYSLSVGGAILKSDIKATIITPIAPHNLNTRPIVIGGEDRLTVKIIDEDNVGQIIIDGQTSIKLNSGKEIEIKYSKKNLKLVIPKNRNYYDILREKLKWGDNLC